MTFNYSRFIYFLKIFLIILAALFFLAVVLWPDRHPKITPESPAASYADDQLHLINARFFTSDKKNQPFAITADKAEELSPSSKLIVLTNMHADVQLKSKVFVTVKAEDALFNQNANFLRARSPIRLQTDNGYHMTLHGATFDLTKNVISAGRTSGFGPMGKMTAGFIQYQDALEQLTLTTSPKISLLGEKRTTVLSADRFDFYLAKDEINATGGVKLSVDAAEFTADKTKITHRLHGEKRMVDTITSGPNVVFKTVAQTAIGTSLLYKSSSDLAVLKGDPVLLTMADMEIKTPEIHYSPSKMIISAVQAVTLRRIDGTTITSDLMKVHLGKNHQPQTLEIIGNIIAKTKEETLYADFAIYYFDTQILKAEHNILLIRGQNRLIGDFAQMDFLNQISSIEKVNTPTHAIIDPADSSLKNAGQPFQKDVKEDQ